MPCVAVGGRGKVACLPTPPPTLRKNRRGGRGVCTQSRRKEEKREREKERDAD